MHKFLKGAGLVAFSFVISGFLYFQSNQVLAKDTNITSVSQSSSAKAVAAKAQDQEQGQENDQRCENKKHPSDGKSPDPNKIDCDCNPKCIDGKRQEDPACKKHCKPDKCDCPDPCPKT